MTKAQRIEEMANAIPDWVHYGSSTYCLMEKFGSNTRKKAISKELIEAGYNNLREFTKKLKTNIENMYADNPYSGIDYNEGLDDALKCIDELLKEYDNAD